MKIPSPQLVAEAFLKSLNPTTYGISTSLPKIEVLDGNNRPRDNWGKDLWVTPKGYGTAVIRPVPIRGPFVYIQVWAKGKDERRRWGAAEALAQDLIELGTDWTTNLFLNMPYAGYRSVTISDFHPTSDVRRIENDPQGLARVEFDAQLNYTLNP